MRYRNWGRLASLLIAVVGLSQVAAAQVERTADAQQNQRKFKRVLLIGQGPDGHPRAAHEYKAGLRILTKCLHTVADLQTILVNADEPWAEGPELIDGADGVVIFLAEGAKWIHQDRARLAALKNLAARGGGITVLHWGMGTRTAEYIEEFVKLAGGCHGGPDRKYKVLKTRTELATPSHAILRGVEPVDVHDEFYYRLKFIQPASDITPLLKVSINGQAHTVAWAWERPDGGRSFGFSGLHYHENWRLLPYRRMVAQAVLWTMKVPVPEDGLPVSVTTKDLALPPE